MTEKKTEKKDQDSAGLYQGDLVLTVPLQELLCATVRKSRPPMELMGIIEASKNHCWAVTRTDDTSHLYVELWVLEGRGWQAVASSGFGFDRASAQRLLPIVQAFLAILESP